MDCFPRQSPTRRTAFAKEVTESGAINDEKVAAVVVTYNRKELLSECLNALAAQTLKLSHILVLDNASTDGTSAMLGEYTSSAKFTNLTVIALPQNVGGAGGFHEGLKEGFAKGFDWLWLMDDDTIPELQALDQLLAARKRFPPEKKPDLLSSKVVWKDGMLHPMNIQWIKTEDLAEGFFTSERRTLPFRTATFVSLLIHRRLIERYGLPLSDYFIAGDDVEYTGRITREEFAVVVPSSLVLHSTETKQGTLDGPAGKFYYYVRNTIWMLLRSNAFYRGEKVKLTFRFVRSVAIYLNRNHFAWVTVRAIARGLWDGISTAPRR